MRVADTDSEEDEDGDALSPACKLGLSRGWDIQASDIEAPMHAPQLPGDWARHLARQARATPTKVPAPDAAARTRNGANHLKPTAAPLLPPSAKTPPRKPRPVPLAAVGERNGVGHEKPVNAQALPPAAKVVPLAKAHLVRREGSRAALPLGLPPLRGVRAETTVM